MGGEFYCQTGIGTGTLPNMLLTGEKRTSFCNLPVNNDNYKICISLLGVYKYIGLLDQQKPMVFKKIVLIMQSIPEVIM